MAEITAALVKELREKSGAGMMDCKKALAESGGDLEAAVDWLRKKGLASAAKKAGRVAADGLVGVAADGGRGALIELNSETDFVARNEQFQAAAREIASLAMEAKGDLETLSAAKTSGGKPVSEMLTDLIATIGENMTLRRCAYVAADPGVVVGYTHAAVADSLGKIGVIVGLKTEGDAAQAAAFGKQLAMHIAAASPRYLKVEDVDQAALDRERDVLREQALASGKPAEIVDKMVEGRLRKFYEEVVLLEQVYVIDGESKVNKAVAAFAKQLGSAVELTGFARFALGEGVEKEETDFAAEVAAAAKG
ncbi:MAG: translation elongation factor Ts [Pseudomonadota bacterium]